MRAAAAGFTAFLLATATALVACGDDDATPGGAAAAGFPMTVDSCGRQVTIDEPPERVLTTGSVAAPLIAAAGGADKIVARSFETASLLGEYEEALSQTPLVSRTEELSREEIIARSPDLVLTYEGSDTPPEDLQAAGIDVLVNRGYCIDTATGDFDEIFADIELLGRLLDTEEAANQEVGELRARVDGTRDRLQGTPRNRTAAALIFGRGTPTISGYGDRSTVDQQMRVLGLRNVFGDVDKRNFEPSIEEIINRNPDVIVLLTQGDQTPEGVRTALLNRAELRAVTAIRDGQIVVLPAGFTLPSPIAVEGLEVLAGQLAAPN